MGSTQVGKFAKVEVILCWNLTTHSDQSLSLVDRHWIQFRAGVFATLFEVRIPMIGTVLNREALRGQNADFAPHD